MGQEDASSSVLTLSGSPYPTPMAAEEIATGL